MHTILVSIGDCFLPVLTAKRCRYRNLGNLLICGVNFGPLSVCLPECDSDKDAPGPSLLTMCVGGQSLLFSDLTFISLQPWLQQPQHNP
ncbi:hypothetical protein HZ326_2829 [Fusarium oxysporum f. sp. albedinis]|nr:hypothetical protein HZ326_2829 [Fusarium oxysporum f. sp. albedinis]